MLSGWKTYLFTAAAAGLVVVGNGLEAVQDEEALFKLLIAGAIAALRAGVAKLPQ